MASLPSIVRVIVLGGSICALLLAGCDASDPDPQQTEFFVRYELTGTCAGIQTVAYTVNGGGVSSGTFTLPWSFESDIMAPMIPAAVAISAICAGDGSTMQSLVARILIDGEERGRQSAEGQGQISATVSIPLR